MSFQTPNDQVPAYDDLFETPPSNAAPGLNIALPFIGNQSKYTPLAADDQTPDIEDHAHQHRPAAPGSMTPEDSHDNQQPHVHCDMCDRQTDRRERRRAQAHCCAMVSRTFVAIALFLMIFGVVAVVMGRKKH